MSSAAIQSRSSTLWIDRSVPFGKYWRSRPLDAPIHLPRHPAEGRQIAIKVLDSFHSCPISEIARLAAPSAPGIAVLAYFDTHDVSNGGTEAINLIIERSVD